MALRGALLSACGRFNSQVASNTRCFSRCVVTRSSIEETTPNMQFPRLSKKQVSTILQEDERRIEINHESILRFENSRLAANNPIEDRNSEGYCNATDGYLFGIFDGHAGVANAQAVSERLFNYIAVNLLNRTELADFCQRMQDPTSNLDLVNFLTHNATYFSKEHATLYRNAIIEYAQHTLSTISDWEEKFTMENALTSAFNKLDEDLGREAFSPTPPDDTLSTQLLTIALSGCCAVTAHIDGPHLHVANTGDCGAVLGTLNEDGTWQAKSLTNAHSVNNNVERSRLLKNHPNEKGTVIKDGRVLGVLEPTRAFGDFRLKLPSNKLRETGEKLRSRRLLEEEVGSFPGYYYEPPQYYYSPPYVTATPEVIYHHLRPKDKFLVLATDGLWNMFKDCENKVVQLVADHMDGAQTIADFQLPKDRNMELWELNEFLKIRKLNISKRAVDSNCATHLIRNALGHTTDQGLSHPKLSAMLTHPEARFYRDDITVTVVYFDEAFLTPNIQ